MTRRVIRTALAVAASSAFLALSAAAPAVASDSSSGQSNVCSAVGVPSTTQTFGVTGVAHATVFTCGNAQATGFQQCANQTVAVPDVVHATVYYCVPVQIGVGLGPASQSVVVSGVGGANVGTG